MKPTKKQTELAKRILETEDKDILNHIQAVLDTQMIVSEDERPEYVNKAIEQGLQELKEGRGIPHDQVMKKYKKWLKK